MKRRIALIFGGRSLESDISVITAMQALAVLRETDFDVTPVYIAADGGFYADGVDEVSAFTPFDASRHKRMVLADGVFSEMRKGKLKMVFRPDAALVCCHGGEGENGVLQGVLEFNGVPYTSAGVLGSALMMDKAAAKCAFEQMLLNVLPYVVVGSQEVEADADGAAERCEEALGLPVIVKPASQGSSIGISTAHDRGELSSALAFAAKFGEKLVVEQLLEDFAEVNCAAYGRGEEVVVSETERPLSSGELLTFDDKYLSGGKAGSGRVTPADVGEEMNALGEDGLPRGQSAGQGVHQRGEHGAGLHGVLPVRGGGSELFGHSHGHHRGRDSARTRRKTHSRLPLPRAGILRQRRQILQILSV